MKYGIPRLENICPRQSAQKGVVFFGECGWFYSLTLPGKNVKVIETKNTMKKTSTRFVLLSESCRLVRGSRRYAPNSFPSGSAEITSRRRRVRPVLRYGLLGPEEAVSWR